MKARYEELGSILVANSKSRCSKMVDSFREVNYVPANTGNESSLQRCGLVVGGNGHYIIFLQINKPGNSLNADRTVGRGSILTGPRKLGPLNYGYRKGNTSS